MTALGLALALAGCAQKSETELASGVGMSTSQMPTSPSHYAIPDDPSEPWSPNYGTSPPAEDAPPAYTPIPVEASATRIAAMDPDTIIRHAIAQHEMRRP